MRDKVFIDTNVFVYFLLDDEINADKNIKAKNVIKLLYNKEIIISVQVLNEIYNTLLKYKVDEKTIQEKLKLIMLKTKLAETNAETLQKCWEIRLKHKYSYWDSLIIASALHSGCKALFTEDLQHNHLIDKTLRVINPFN